MEQSLSKNNVPIRLPYERWVHITENHDDLSGYFDDILNAIEDPDWILKGYCTAFLAVKKFDVHKFLVVVYKEIDGKDGFVITAYFTTKLKLNKEIILWQKR
jgi:hypothetical protein